MTTSNFDGHRWPSPTLTTVDAASVAVNWWGIEGEVSALESNQDQNFRITDGDGRQFVLKVANERTPPEAVEAQNAVLTCLARTRPPFDHPTIMPTVDGEEIVVTAGHAIRLITFVEGEPMHGPGELDDVRLQTFGRLAAHNVLALAAVDIPGAHRVTQWDPRHAAEVVAGLRGDLDDDDLLVITDQVLAQSAAALDPFRASLPRQVIHGDLSDFNVVGRRDRAAGPLGRRDRAAGPLGRRDRAARLTPTGIIDFGDVVHTWRVAELAILATGLVGRSASDPLRAVVEVTRGFSEIVALDDDELDAAWGVVLARAASLAVSDAQQVAIEPGNAYARHALDVDRAILDAVARIPPELARTSIRLAAGRAPDPRWARVRARLAELANDPTVVGWAFPPGEVSDADIEVIDLTVETADLAAGTWHDRDALRARLHRPGHAVVARHDEVRITSAVPDLAVEPRSVHMGHDFFVAAGTTVVAPVAAVVDEISGGSVWLRPVHPDLGQVSVRLLNVVADVEVGTELGLGDHVGSVAEQARATGVPAHLHVQTGVGVSRPSGGVAARHRVAWSVHSPPLYPDPAWRGPAARSAAEAHRRRSRHVARAQRTYYPDRPLEIVRGWRHHLYDTDGRTYLDMVNNVAVIGHSHPAVTEAARRQFDRLNTNSRFLYPALTELADRLVARCPTPLSSVFLVNSGSEASDLALRLARHATGHRGVVAIEGGYHGWTGAVTEYTSNRFDNPRFHEHRPPYVEIVASPDGYRGRFRGAPDPGAEHAAEVAAVCRRLEPHGGVAAFVFEGLLGNQGGLDLPAGYLTRALAAVRSVGGVAIADEVQVGYGRTGSSWWAFENHGVVPDIVTVAKAMGNGHPVGAVITTPDIAEAFAADYPFFSSVGGGPVSCEVALAVLQVMDDEGLQSHAALLGARLRSLLTGLMDQHPMIGAVHGTGLYLGVDLVLDRETRAPAVDWADAVCAALRDRGVIVQTTGDLGNIVKVKPPLCITESSARFFVEQLDTVLGELRTGRPPPT